MRWFGPRAGCEIVHAGKWETGQWCRGVILCVTFSVCTVLDYARVIIRISHDKSLLKAAVVVILG